MVMMLLLAATLARADEPPCVGKQLATAMAAQAGAQRALDQAISAIDKGQPDTARRLSVWLGVRSSAESASVRARLARARVLSKEITFLCAVKTDARIGDVYGYVRPDKSFVMTLGAFFFTAPEAGFSSKLGVIVHEMTHFLLTGATRDPKVYGPEEARRLAATDAGSARQNAENLEYFVEAVVFGL
jgi:hypothetical protein